MDLFKDKEKRKSFLIALLIYGGLAVLFFYVGLKYPDPPLEETGVEISMADYGFDDEGFGREEPSQSIPKITESEPIEQIEEKTPTATIVEEITTQDESEISVKEPVENEVNPPKEPKEKPTEQTPVEPVSVKEPDPVIDDKLKNVMGEWDESESSNEGTNENTSGNEGIESGKPEGKGTFGGNGSSFELGGRSMLSGPKVGEKPKEEGKVVLNIWVDKNGHVLRTTQNLKESNTTSQYLFNLAKNAAAKAKFNPSPDAPPQQKGKMTFVFILR